MVFADVIFVYYYYIGVQLCGCWSYSVACTYCYVLVLFYHPFCQTLSVFQISPVANLSWRSPWRCFGFYHKYVVFLYVVCSYLGLWWVLCSFFSILFLILSFITVTVLFLAGAIFFHLITSLAAVAIGKITLPAASPLVPALCLDACAECAKPLIVYNFAVLNQLHLCSNPLKQDNLLSADEVWAILY